MGLNTRIQYGASGITIRGPKNSEVPSFNLDPYDVVVVPTTYTLNTIKDANVDIPDNPTTLDKTFMVQAQPQLGMPQTYNIVNNTPSICTLTSNQAGAIGQRVSDGTAIITMENYIANQQRTFPVQRVTQTPPNRFVNWVTGSLARHMTDQIDSRLAGKTADSSTLNIWNPYNNTTPSYSFNTNCWLSGVDLTCISPWTTRGGSNPNSSTVNGVSVTPRHWLGVSHLAAFVGNQVRFVGSDGITYTRTVTARTNISISGISDPDVNLCLLDSDLPATVTPVKVLPSNYLSYLASMEVIFDSGNAIFDIPVVNSNQFKTLQVSNLKGFVNVGAPVNPGIPSWWYAYTAQPPSSQAKRLEFYRRQIVGDSGSPCFGVINNSLVLLFCYTFGNAGVIHYGNYKTELDAAIVSMGGGGGYTVGTVDLSSFPTY